MAASAISHNSRSHSSHGVNSSQGSSESQQAGGSDEITQMLQQIMEMLKQMEGGSSQKAAGTRVAW